MKTETIWNLTMLGVMVITILVFTYYHEAAHAQICQYFHGNITRYSVGINEIAVYCMSDDSEAQRIAQSQVDAFGYQIIPIMIGVFAAIVVFGNLLIDLHSKMEMEVRLNEVRQAVVG
jgi:hypothetical protein